MNYHQCYGLSAPEIAWVPAPRYLLRRQRVLKLLEPLPRGRLLEIGCGSGALLHDMSIWGFTCDALETSVAALEIARYMNAAGEGVHIYRHTQLDWDGAFDYVAAFEVLEHIEDDLAALKQWSTWLKHGGHLLLSVPAHPRRWNASDVWAGHYRRYERKTLKDIIEKAGFLIEYVECYGFPLANFIEPIRALHYAKLLRSRSHHGISQQQRSVGTQLSGISRSLEMKLYPLQASCIGVNIMKFFCFLQDIFADTDLGNGYLVLARKQ